jgi:hypothetical protein
MIAFALCADKDVAVRFGWPVSQDELRPPARGRAQVRPRIHSVPTGNDFQRLLWRVAAHVKPGLRRDHRAIRGLHLGRQGDDVLLSRLQNRLTRNTVALEGCPDDGACIDYDQCRCSAL